MPGRQDDDLARRSDRGGRSTAATPPSRSLPLAAAVALAVGATLVAVLTADPTLLRGCVVVAAWAGVAAAYVAVRQLAERRVAAGREAELRRAYDRELDLEAAGRREHELVLENDLRRQADEALRAETAELGRLREQLARVSGLGDSLAGLARLREDVAALGALRGDLAALSRLHEDVGELGGLRDELAALRAELTEKIDAEMLVERVLLRTRASRTAERAAPGEPAGVAGEVGPPATRAYEVVGREREWDPLTDPLDEAPEQESLRYESPRYGSDRYQDERYDPPAWRAGPVAPAGEPTPLGWLADHALLDPLDQPWTTPTQAAPAAELPRPVRETEPPTTGPVAVQRPRPVPHRRRRADEAGGPPSDPALAATTEHPAHRAGGHPSGSAAVRVPPRPAPQPDTAGQGRLSEILAESSAPPAEGRRRRRYRDDDETDDVLSRVLRGE